jgi:hypothetical protein
MVLASMEHAVLSLIFGKLTPKLPPTQLIHATFKALRNVKVQLAVMEIKGIMESVIRTVVTSTLTEWVTRTSLELAQTSKLTPTSHSLL